MKLHTPNSWDHACVFLTHLFGRLQPALDELCGTQHHALKQKLYFSICQTKYSNAPENKEAQEPAAPFSIKPRSSIFSFPEGSGLRWVRWRRLTSYSGHQLLCLAQGGEEDAVLADVGHQGGGGAGVEAPPDPFTRKGRPDQYYLLEKLSQMTHVILCYPAPGAVNQPGVKVTEGLHLHLDRVHGLTHHHHRPAWTLSRCILHFMLTLLTPHHTGEEIQQKFMYECFIICVRHGHVRDPKLPSTVWRWHDEDWGHWLDCSYLIFNL